MLDASYWSDTGDIPKQISETERASVVVASLDKVIAEIPTLAGIYQSRLRDNINWPVMVHLEELRDHLDNTARMARIWDKAHTVRGGKNWRAYAVAILIGQAFLDLKQAITFGNRGDGSGPSTKFGKIVEFIFRSDDRLSKNGAYPNWEKPAKEAFNYYRSLSG